jgi:hypothetical protein
MKMSFQMTQMTRVQQQMCGSSLTFLLPLIQPWVQLLLSFTVLLSLEQQQQQQQHQQQQQQQQQRQEQNHQQQW